MKIQCDVCEKDEASVFCSADEAALCNACDHRVHHANKLASQHQRFTLLHHSSAKQAPLCDICQDRAILCIECDIPIHIANEHTQKHNRFLLTGVKLLATSALHSSSNSSLNYSNAEDINGCASVPNLKSQNRNSPVTSSAPFPPVSQVPIKTPSNAKNNAMQNTINASLPAAAIVEQGNGNNGTTSSISEYFMETLPGWHVEDFLDFSSSAPFGLCKSNDNAMSFWDADFDGNLSSNSFASESMGMWLPRFRPSDKEFSGLISFKEDAATSIKAARKWLRVDDGCFTVPQMQAPSKASKRSKIF